MTEKHCLYRTRHGEYNLWAKAIVVEEFPDTVKIKIWSPFFGDGPGWFEKTMPREDVFIFQDGDSLMI
jgi:hypothetical protein